MTLHGPHQVAQKSTSTGCCIEAAMTSLSKFSRVTSIISGSWKRDRKIQPLGASMGSSVQVGVVMGSSSDWDTMQHAVAILQEFGVGHEARVVSAHRMPDDMLAYAPSAASRGLKAIIAGAGGAAHLPGMLAAKTAVPVLGVPVPSRHLQGVDSLHSIVKMPKGIPVATFAIGAAGAANAALFAVAMLANEDEALRQKLEAFRQRQTDEARQMSLPAAK